MNTDTKEFLKEVQRNGERYLDAQMKMALAADQRAVALGGIFAAAASVAVGFGVGTEPLKFASISMAIGLTIAAFFAFRAARPITFHVSGYAPSDWKEDIDSGKKIEPEIYYAIFEHLNRRIAQNDVALKANAALLYYAMCCGLLSVVAGTFLGMLSIA